MEEVKNNIGQSTESEDSDLTVREKLEEEFQAAISAALGDYADQQYHKHSVSEEDLLVICKKVAFHLDL